MDSQITLVHPPPSDSLTTTTYHLVLRGGLQNGQIHLDLNRPPTYTIRSDKHGARTELVVLSASTEPRVVAFIKRHTLRSDEIAFVERDGEGSVKKQKDWLKGIKLPNGWPSTVMETSHGSFVWRSWPKQRLALYEHSDTEFVSPLAFLSSNPFGLVVENRIKHLHVDIIMATLVLQTNMNEGERQSSRAQGQSDQNRTIMGYYPDVGTPMGRY